MKSDNRIVIGIDQSYKNTGISIFLDGKKKMIRSIHLESLNNNTEKREMIIKTLKPIIGFCLKKQSNTDKITCIIERIRLRSQGFININYIKSIGALDAVIIDLFTDHNIKVFSVDTRCWKSQIVGTSKPESNTYGVDEKKWPTIKWCIDQGWEKDIIETAKRKTKKTFERDEKFYKYNDDAADSAGIALFGFYGEDSKLKKEV